MLEGGEHMTEEDGVGGGISLFLTLKVEEEAQTHAGRACRVF